MSQARYRVYRTGAFLIAVAVFAAVLVGASTMLTDQKVATVVTSSPGAYPELATRAIRALETEFYNGTGEWHMCVPKTHCNTKNSDWGADALTNVLAFRWKLSHDRSVLPLITRLEQTMRPWTPSRTGSSDTAMWDAVAAMREYQVTKDTLMLRKAQEAFAWVTSPRQAGFATGACPSVDYQWTDGLHGLKTLETGSNYVKAAILLYQATGNRTYLTDAETEYAISRQYFLSPSVPLYTDYIIDNGSTCRVLPGRYFASVNGNMIWSGFQLARITGQKSYQKQALATAHAVATHLSDSAGVFTDLQADNDIVGPLVEAMYSLATLGHQKFARTWLLTAASAAAADMSPAGSFGRFFDGPPPAGLVTAWQTSGGTELMQTAAALDRTGSPSRQDFWSRARYVSHARDLRDGVVRITFTGRAIALIGDIGAQCCMRGHAAVSVDGVRTFNRTGIWQNESSPSIRQPGQVLFAWRWRTAGRHTITISPAAYNAIEGGPAFSMTGYLVVR